MKFVALALAVLLAVGSQAASLQADASDSPSQLQHLRGAADMIVTQIKESLKNSLNSIDDPQYKDFKDNLSQRLEDVHTQLKTLQGSVSPVTDNIFTTVALATADFRTSLMSEIENLKTNTEDQRNKLREVVNKHLEDYRSTLEPIFTHYIEKAREDMAAAKTKFEPVIGEMKAKVTTNVEETKSALMPIVDAVRNMLTQYLEQFKAAVGPYMTEYKEEVEKFITQAKSVNTEEMKAKITPPATEAYAKVQEIIQTISAAFKN